MASRKTVRKKKGEDIIISHSLTEQQRMFVLELMADPAFNATEAARKAGYKNPSVAGSRLLNNTAIKRFLRQKQDRREQKTEIKGEHVVRELANMAFRDIADLCDAEGRILTDNLRSIPEHARRCIDGIKQRHDSYFDGEHQHEVVTYELKMVPKLAAMEVLMKHLGIDKPRETDVGEEEQDTRPVVNWDDYYNRIESADPIEEQIKALQALPAPVEPELIDAREKT